MPYVGSFVGSKQPRRSSSGSNGAIRQEDIGGSTRQVPRARRRQGRKGTRPSSSEPPGRTAPTSSSTSPATSATGILTRSQEQRDAHPPPTIAEVRGESMTSPIPPQITAPGASAPVADPSTNSPIPVEQMPRENTSVDFPPSAPAVTPPAPRSTLVSTARHRQPRSRSRHRTPFRALPRPYRPCHRTRNVSHHGPRRTRRTTNRNLRLHPRR